MANQPIRRVRYREQQRLSTTDLNIDQTYHTDMARRHLVGLHGWGIVCGLVLSEDNKNLTISAGKAVDGYGRWLIVPQKWIVETKFLTGEAFPEENGSRRIDVWLRYARIPETPNLPEKQIHRPQAHRRWREVAHVRLTNAVGEPPDPYDTPFVRDPSCQHDAHLPLLDDPDPNAKWPVYLGRVLFSGGVLSVMEDVKRPYISLRSERIVAPSGRAQMEIGSELAKDKRRFTVSLPGDAEGKWKDRFSIDSEGRISLLGPTTLNRHTAHAKAVRFAPLDSVPATSAPWQIYRTQVTVGDRTVNEWRLEIKPPAEEEDAANQKLQIGVWESGRFREKLTIQSDGTVNVLQDMVVNGQLTMSPVQPSFDDPAFMGALVTTSHSAMLASAAISDPKGIGLLNISLNIPTHISINEPISYTSNVQNISQSEMSSVTLYEHVYLGDVLLSDRTIATGFSLLADSAKEIPGIGSAPIILSPIISVGQPLKIIITAVGFGPTANQVETFTVADVIITEGPSPQ